MGKRGERLLFARAMLCLAATDLALRVFGFRRLVRWAQRERRGASAALDADAITRAHRCARAIQVIATHRPLRVRCLRRSLALHLWLRRHGLASELRIGVRREFHALQAHAWVELGGEVLNDHPLALAAFVPLYSSAQERPGGEGRRGRRRGRHRSRPAAEHAPEATHA